MQDDLNQENPPIFNIPSVVAVTILIILICHVVRVWVVPERYGQDFLMLFAVIPARYSDLGGLLPYSLSAWYAPVSHAFVHADWTHLLINMAWMLAFGSAVARRLGNAYFLLLFVISAIVAFGFHLVTHPNEFVPMIGASGAVSAFMGAAIRLPRDPAEPVLTLFDSFRNRGFLVFVGIWLGLNLLVGLQPGLIGGEGVQIAWQAHVGGFLTGLLLCRVLDSSRPSMKKN